jgi:hypothetical protein
MNQPRNDPPSDSEFSQQDVSSEPQRQDAKQTARQQQGGSSAGTPGQGGQQKKGMQSGQQQQDSQDRRADPGTQEDGSNRVGLRRPAGGTPNTPRQ